MPEPRTITIADSMVLVIGVAVALALPWFNGWVEEPQPVMEPRWRIILWFVEEAVGKLSLALIPLMMYRRARFGGLCRPGELLLVVCASRVIAGEVYRVSHLEIRPDGIWADDLYWATLKLAGVACLAALGALIVFGRELSDIAVCSLLVIAVAGSHPWPTIPLWRLHNAAIGDGGIPVSQAADYAFFIGFFALESLVPAAIGAAAVWDAITRRARAGVMAGIGLGLAAVNLVITLAVDLPSNFTAAWPRWNDHILYVLLAGPAAAAILGCSVYYLIRPRLARWFALRQQRCLAIAGAEEDR